MNISFNFFVSAYVRADRCIYDGCVDTECKGHSFDYHIGPEITNCGTLIAQIKVVATYSPSANQCLHYTPMYSLTKKGPNFRDDFDHQAYQIITAVIARHCKAILEH